MGKVCAILFLNFYMIWKDDISQPMSDFELRDCCNFEAKFLIVIAVFQIMNFYLCVYYFVPVIMNMERMNERPVCGVSLGTRVVTAVCKLEHAVLLKFECEALVS